METVYQFIGKQKIGIFGSGHLGREIGRGLLNAGLPRHNLVLCHRGSSNTERAIAEAGLADLIIPAKLLASISRIILYAVRPQDFRAIKPFALLPDAILISMLAGVPLTRLPICPPTVQRIRVMTSSPETLREGIGIAALYPSSSVLVRELLTALKLHIIDLRHESDVHAFTALGPCLPIALTYWEALGKEVDPTELSMMVSKFELPDESHLIGWARNAQPRNLSPEALSQYISHSATPGGVTEAILKAIDAGEPLALALERGIRRSQELAS